VSHPILAERAFGSAEPRISGDHRRTDLTSSTPCPPFTGPHTRSLIPQVPTRP